MALERWDITEMKHTGLSIPDIKGLAWSMKHRVMLLSEIIYWKFVGCDIDLMMATWRHWAWGCAFCFLIIKHLGQATEQMTLEIWSQKSISSDGHITENI